jgi:hypothetical protein
MGSQWIFMYFDFLSFETIERVGSYNFLVNGKQYNFLEIGNVFNRGVTANVFNCLQVKLIILYKFKIEFIEIHVIYIVFESYKFF